ncbi:hypothetical protein OL229_11155 [Neisseriaceae bacterium JH1-16]|nr:hypothetical protein [Neisseriaceae bacterium JH1-16]
MSPLRYCLALALCLLTPLALAVGQLHRPLPENRIPLEVRPFVPNGYGVIELLHNDLNGDGLLDYLLVLERDEDVAPGDFSSGQRPLLILEKQKNGSLKLTARNDHVVYCSSCGGMIGDPFVSVSLAHARFSVHQYGGSAWRWSTDYSFVWVSGSWLLASVDETSFLSGEPEQATTHHHEWPRDFGRIELSIFNPETWRGRGPR